jgi:hypothetical protein
MAAEPSLSQKRSVLKFYLNEIDKSQPKVSEDMNAMETIMTKMKSSNSEAKKYLNEELNKVEKQIMDKYDKEEETKEAKK